jgi:hypothetical protein
MDIENFFKQAGISCLKKIKLNIKIISKKRNKYNYIILSNILYYENKIKMCNN